MAGWILNSSRDIPYIENRISVFAARTRHILNEELSIKQISITEDSYLVFWSFRNDNHFPDLQFCKNKDNGLFVLVDGSIKAIEGFDKNTLKEKGAAFIFADNWRKIKDNLIISADGTFSICVVDMNEKNISLFTDRLASRSIWISLPQTFLLQWRYSRRKIFSLMVEDCFHYLLTRGILDARAFSKIL
jgi:hypothetical protein